jgi:hypothetical protein
MGAIFFALVFVFLVLTGIGTSLPIEHHADCTASFDGTQQYLFEAVADDGTSTKWRPDIASAVLVSGSGPTAVWRETDVHGGVRTYRTTAYVDGQKLARTIDYIPGMPFAGTWTYEISRDEFPPAHESSAVSYVSIHEDGQIYNPFFRFLARYVFGYTQTMDTYLTDLGRLKRYNPPIVCLLNTENLTSGK